MDNRFGFKDLVAALLLGAILVSIWVAMWQYDRQWKVMQSIDTQLSQQRDAISRLADTLKLGVASPGSALGTGAGTTVPAGTTASGGGGGGGGDNPFARLLEAKAQPDYAEGDWFVDSFGQSVGKLTPLISLDAYQATIESYVQQSLLTRDPETLEWLPLIAEAWQVSDDGLTIGFDLRRNATFSDGVPITSADVLFTLDMIRNPEINAPRLVPYYEVVESVTAEGPHRVVFKLKEPYFQSLSITGGMNIMAKHFYERFTPEEFNASNGLLFGSGPYKLSVDPEEWVSGSGRIELVRNDNYWGPRPTLDKLVWREISDENAQLVSFRNGEIDRYAIPTERYDQLVDDADLKSKGQLFQYTAMAGGYRYIGWNQSRNGEATPFADVRVRMAMTMLVDRQEMAEQLMSGQATVATGPFNPLSPQSDPGIEPWPYDPAAAKALLKEAGYEDRNGDGTLEDDDGRPFVFKLIYPATMVNYQLMAGFLKDAYARAGITMELDPTEWNTMIQRINDRQFDAITLGWGGTIESDPKQIFHSQSIDDGGDNYVSYRNAELDRMIDQARVTVDEDKRNALWHAIHRTLHKDQPYTFLFNFKSNIFIAERFRNVELTRLGINDRTEYYVPRGQQRWTR